MLLIAVRRKNLEFYLNFGRISSMSKFIEVALFNALRFAFSSKNAYVNLEVTDTADKYLLKVSFRISAVFHLISNCNSNLICIRHPIHPRLPIQLSIHLA
jgi:hypothetical protein